MITDYFMHLKKFLFFQLKCWSLKIQNLSIWSQVLLRILHRNGETLVIRETKIGFGKWLSEMCLNNYTRAFLHDCVHNDIDIFFDFSNDVLITQYAQDR